MLPTSLAVVLATVALTLAPALVLFWGWRRGFFRDFDAQSRVIFEPDDLRTERPWESPTEQLTREVAYGPPRPAEPGAWGEGREAPPAARAARAPRPERRGAA